MIFNTRRIYDLDTVLGILVHTTGNNGKKKQIIENEMVKVSSLRLTTFKEKGITCVCCGREGSHFRLQKGDREKVFHLGLWTEDGVEMTKDHIVPKSMGGYDHLDNMQTMCARCNGNKKNAVTEDDYAKGYYDEVFVNTPNEGCV